MELKGSLLQQELQSLHFKNVNLLPVLTSYRTLIFIHKYVQADLFLHNFALMRFEYLYHFSYSCHNVQFNVIRHRRYAIIF
jgi:hypothetical protein